MCLGSVKFRAVELKDEKLVSELLMSHLVEFLRDHPGVCVVVASPGAGPKILNVYALYVKGHGRVWKTQQSGNCLLAVLTNWIDIVLGRASARGFFLQLRGPR